MKIQTPDMEKICVNDIFLKTVQICKELLKLKNSPIKKWAKGMKQHFIEEDIGMVN